MMAKGYRIWEGFVDKAGNPITRKGRKIPLASMKKIRGVWYRRR